MKRYDILFRVDASLDIGTGHVMRCLALADSLQTKNNYSSVFICRNLQGNLSSVIQSRGYKALLLENTRSNNNKTIKNKVYDNTYWHDDAKLCSVILQQYLPKMLIVDHYSINRKWLEYIKDYCEKIMVIDDLNNRFLYCDLLLDQTPFRNHSDYKDKVSKNCKIITGAKYALLHRSFAKYRTLCLNRKNTFVNTILLSLGGADKNNYTKDILKLIKHCSFDILPESCTIKVVIGISNPWLKDITEYLRNNNRPYDIIVGTDNMAKLISESDIAIGTASVAALERCCLGLPSLTVCLAKNQELYLQNLLKSQAIIDFKSYRTNFSKNHKTFESKIKLLLANMSLLSTNSITVCDGSGCDTVARIIEEIIIG